MATPDMDQELHLTDRFSRAVDYARHLHIQRRKGTQIPYMAHLLGVASLVMGEAGQVPFPVTEDMIIAALLHDAAEDHGGQIRITDIRCNFGSGVAGMVEGLSDTFVEDPCEKEEWEDRKRAYLKRLQHESAETLLISAADKLYNARTILDEYRAIGAEVWERFRRSRDLQIWYFHELLKVFKSAGTNRVVDELGRVVAKLEDISADEQSVSKKQPEKG